MRAILQRDFVAVARRRGFFVARAAVVLVPLLFAAAIVEPLSAFSRDQTGRAIFAGTGVAAAACLLLIVPALLADALASERARGRLDVLRASPLGVAGIVLGIWSSRIAILLSIVVAVIPFVASSVVFGGVTPWQVVEATAVLVAAVSWTSAVAIAASAKATSLARALSAAFGSVLGLVLLSILVPFLLRVLLPSAVGGTAREVATLATAWNPLVLLVRISAPFGPGSAAPLLGAGPWIAATATTVLALAAAVRRLGAEVPVGAAGEAEPLPRDGATAADVPAARRRRRGVLRRERLLDRDPALWIEVARSRRPLRSMTGLVSILLPLAVIELMFCMVLVRKLTGGAEAARPDLVRIHLLPMAFATIVALVRALAAGVAAFQKDREANTNDVLFASPLSSRTLARAKARGAFRGPFRWWLMAVGHGALGVLLGDLHAAAVVGFLAAAAAVTAGAGALALKIGLAAKSSTRAGVATVAVLAGLWVVVPLIVMAWATRWMWAMRWLYDSASLMAAIALGWHPLSLAIRPLGFEPESGMGDFDTTCVWFVYLGAYAFFAGLSLTTTIPERFAARREDRGARSVPSLGA